MVISVLSLFVAVYVFGLVGLFGNRLEVYFRVPSDIRPFAAIALGWAAVSYTMLALGFLQAYRLTWIPWVLICLSGSYGLFGLGSLKKVRQSLGTLWSSLKRFVLSQPRWVQIALVFVGCLWTGSLLSALAPSTGWDANTYHLAIPHLFLLSGGIKPLVTINGSFFQLFPQMQYLFVMWLGFARSAQVLPLLYLLSLIGVMAVWSRQLTKSVIPWAIFILCSIPAVWFAGYESLVDIQGWFYFTLGCYFLYLFAKEQETRHLPFFAVFLGMAVGCKVTNILFLPAVPVLVFALSGHAVSVRRAYRTAIRTTLITAVAAAPWYLHGLIVKGNPIWPFFATLVTPGRLVILGLAVFATVVIGDLSIEAAVKYWKSNTKVVIRSGLGLVVLAVAIFAVLYPGLFLHFLTRLWFILVSPFLMTFAPEGFGGDAPRLGPLVLSFLPLLFLVRVRGPGERWTAGLLWWYLSFYTLWLLLFDLNDTRHGLIIIPGILVMLGPRLEAVLSSGPATLKRVIIGAVLLSLLYNGAVVAKVLKPRFAGVFGADASVYLSQAAEPLYPEAKKIPEYPVYNFANQMIPLDSTVLLVGEYEWYYLDRQLINGRPDQQDLIVYDRYDSPEALWTYLRDIGVTHIITGSASAEQPSDLRNWTDMLLLLQPLYTANGITLYQM